MTIPMDNSPKHRMIRRPSPGGIITSKTSHVCGDTQGFNMFQVMCFLLFVGFFVDVLEWMLMAFSKIQFVFMALEKCWVTFAVGAEISV